MSTTITIAGNSATEPIVRFTNSGKAVLNLRVLVNNRTVDKSTGEWIDGEPTGHNVVVFGQQAENLANSIDKGSRVMVEGRVTTKAYLDKSGEKRTKTEVIAREVAVSCRYATAQVSKATPVDDDETAASVEELRRVLAGR